MTWNAEYGFEIRPGMSVYAVAGTAFRAPDATDRYGYGGNPDLLPETAHSYELGFRHQVGSSQSVSVGLFRNELDDLIQFVFTNPETFEGENRNVERARIDGLEAAWNIRRRPLARARSWLDAAPWRTTGLGVVGMTGGLFAVVMGIVLLGVNLVGLPVALLVAVFTIVLLFVAQAIGLVQLGGWICSLLRLPVRSPFVLGIIGVLVVAAPQIIADLSRLSGRSAVTPLQVAHVLS